jgi:YD repeat-containing protein
MNNPFRTGALEAGHRRRRFAPALLGGAIALGTASAASAQYEPPKQMTLSPTGVDLTTGRFTYKATDLSVGPLTLERSYVGGVIVDGSNFFGLNWTHNFSIYVVVKDQMHEDGVYLVRGRSPIHFTYSPSTGTYHSTNPDSAGETLVLVNGAFVYTDKQGNVYTFSASVHGFPPYTNFVPPLPNQRIARIDYADGHVLTFTYAGQQLRQVASNEGYSLVFDYGANGYVSKACGFNRAATLVTAATTCDGAALAVSYTYAPANWTQLTGVVDLLGRNWGYTYVDDSNVSKMTCVRQVNSSTCLIANNFSPPAGAGPSLRQTTADGGIWDYDIVRPDKSQPRQPGEPLTYSAGSYTGPEGIEVSAVFGSGLLGSYSDGGKITELTWDGIELASLAYPEGNKVSYGRDGRSNLTSETWTPKPSSFGLSPVSQTTYYPEPWATDCTTVVRKICNKPAWREDYKGNRTTYTYDPAHGGVLTETGPLAGGVQPQVRTEYAARTAWVLGAGGGFVAEATPIYLPVRKSYCAKGAASGSGCALAGDEVITTYDYGPDSGPNNLNLRGETVTADGVSRRTCYRYDAQGNRISTTTPRGVTGTCS